MAKAGRSSDQFPLRLPNGMRDRIKKSAEAAGRSMNAEIVERLESSFWPNPEGEVLQARDARHEVNAKALEYLKRAIELLAAREV